jgi:hypothetical protein
LRRERSRLGAGHRAALQRQGVDGGGRQQREVSGLGRAQVALGGHVQPDRLGGGRGEPAGEPRRTALAVVVVGASHQFPAAQLRLVGERVGAAQVAGVVQQRGGDKGTGRARVRGERSGLQQVLRDGDRLAQVVGGPFRREQFG